MKIWSDKEVCSLFERVEKCKSLGGSLAKAFAEHAQKFGRKPNSVRNYYYHEVDNLAADSVRAANLKIDISKHGKTHYKNFDKVQEGDLFDKIDKLTAQGLSVRAACLKISGGDLALMTRCQNKFQNMKRKLENNKKFLQNRHKNAKNSVKMSSFNEVFGQDSAKIIPFKAPQTLSDTDLNSLFLGLVRLVKKSAQEETFATVNELRSIVENKENEISNLKNELLDVKRDNETLMTKIKELSHTNKKIALEKHLALHTESKQKADL